MIALGSPRPVPIGVGPRFQPAPGAHAIAEMPCLRGGGRRFGVHVELFAAGRVVILPAGIGIARPHRRAGAYVHGGRCSQALRTREPTGVVEVRAGVPATLGDLFAIWGRPLRGDRLAHFRGRVRAYVGGRRRHGAPGAIPLRRHAQIVLAVGPSVPVHAEYVFPPGL